jgi:hypothetical protein
MRTLLAIATAALLSTSALAQTPPPAPALHEGMSMMGQMRGGKGSVGPGVGMGTGMEMDSMSKRMEMMMQMMMDRDPVLPREVTRGRMSWTKKDTRG